MSKEIVFLCGARDYHAMDWYRSAKKLIKNKKIVILTDLIKGEGFKKLVTDDDILYKLLIIDKFLFKRQTGVGNIWRNLLKLVVLPIQIIKLKRFYNRFPNSVFHAHGMYYLFLAALAKVPYVGTPQGSEILVRPFRSKLYKKFAVIALTKSRVVTVDSVNMKEKIKSFCHVDAEIIQNGIDIESINKFIASNENGSFERKKYLSIRAVTPLYRIDKIIETRNSCCDIPLSFIYPFYEYEYKEFVFSKLKIKDEDLNRVSREEMYRLLFSTKLVFSIPISDSSPRSVYESIFCGSAVAISYNKYFDSLPDCMRSRIIIVNINEKDWLNKAIEKAEIIIKEPFIASKEARELFDQQKSFEKLSKLLLS